MHRSLLRVLTVILTEPAKVEESRAENFHASRLATAWRAAKRQAAFCAASWASACFPMVLGRVLWPGGLSAGTENLFWPATAVHVAGLMRLGLGGWPAVVLGTFAGQLSLGLPWPTSVVNALGNLAEAVVVVAALRAAGVGRRPLHSIRGTLTFLGAALVGPLCSSMPGAATLWLQGRLPAEDYWAAVGVWSFANATSIVLLAPFLMTAGRETLRWHGRAWELAGWLGFGVVAGCWSFHAVFSAGGGVNYAFLVFPFVLYAAVRFGVAETSVALLWVMALMYVSLVVHAPSIQPEKIKGTLWFLQVYGFVLGASGLLFSALTAGRLEAELSLRLEQTKSLEANLREERARLETLRYQINPHFLFNSLNSIRAVSSDASRDMITELAEYMRATLSNRGSDRAPLRDELRCVRHYLEIERMRHGEALRVEFEIDETAQDHAVPLFLLQPLVENAIRHGFEQSKGAFSLRISARREAGALLLEVANTGRWRPASTGGVGLGMENVRRRLALGYGDAAGLRVRKESGWVGVELRIPAEAAG